MENPRIKAYKALLAIACGKAFSNEEVQKTLGQKSLTDEDARLFTRLVYGVLQNQMVLDLLIAKGSRRPIKKLDIELLIILRIALFQIYYLDKVPAYAAVNEAVKMAKKFKPAGQGFINGILRGLLRQETSPEKEIEKLTNPKDRFSVTYSIPPWIAEKYGQVFSKNQVALLFSRFNQVPPLTLRTNILRTSPDQLVEVLMEDGFQVSRSILLEEALYVDKIPEGQLITESKAYRKGYFTIQDEGAMLVSHWLGSQKGERILDMCAAPGGKTTHMAQGMANTGTIIARDIYDHRLELVRHAIKRMGITNVQVEKFDGTIDHPADVESFDRVLLDAPCSGLGVIGRKPEIRYRVKKDGISDLLPLQAALLDKAYQLLKAGGFLLYSTCTVNPAENEEQITNILKKHPDLELVTCPPYLENYYYFPGDRGSDCFFMCKLYKRDKGC